MNNIFLKILSNDNGTPGSVRLILLLWSLGILFVYIVTSLKSVPISMANIPETNLYVLATIIGGKTVEKFIENKKCEPNS